MDDDVEAYIAGINEKQRPVFDRIHRIVLEARPDAAVTISYQIPTFVAGSSRLYVGAWKNWVSLYGWGKGNDSGFTQRHPELTTGRGTIQLTPAAATAITDDELRALITAALTEQR